MRNEVSDAEREEVRAQLGAEWTRLEAGWNEGDKSSVAPWVPGFPARMPLSGLGGGRLLVLAPEPVLWPTWQIVVDNHRNVRGLSFEYVDAHGTALPACEAPVGGRQYECVFLGQWGKDGVAPAHVLLRISDEVWARRPFGGVGGTERTLR